MATRTISNAGGAYNTVGAWLEGATPTSADDVVATATSGDLSISFTQACRSMDLTGYTGTVTHNSGSTLNIGAGTSGPGGLALKLVPGMSLAGNITFIGTSGTVQTITTAGNVFTAGTIGFNDTGSWQLTDDLTCNALSITKGSFNANGKNITAVTVTGSSAQVRSITLGSGTCTVTGSGATTWNFGTTTNLTFSGASSTIALTNVTSSAKTFAGGGLTYGTVSITTGGSGIWTFSGDNTFTKLTSIGSTTKTIKFTAGSTTTLTGSTDSFFSGVAGNLITIASTSNGSAWNLVKTSGSVVCDYISLQDSAASGGATFTAGNHSTDVSGNSGWVFPPRANLAACSLASVCTLSGAGNIAKSASIDLSSICTLSATGSVDTGSAAHLSSVCTLSATGSVSYSVACAMFVVTTVTAAASVPHHRGTLRLLPRVTDELFVLSRLKATVTVLD